MAMQRQISWPASARAFTLVEMLVAMAITLVMMAAVVTLFANVSNSVRNRRATIEMSGQLRHLRNVLQQDLQGATCPGVTWQRPESNHGYIEIIEGLYREGNASNLLDGQPGTRRPNWPPSPGNPEIDHTLSTIPSSNMPFADADWVTDGGGLGDYDDVLMLTVRNEHEPFVGRVPTNVRQPPGEEAVGFADWSYATAESTLAEVVWYAVENPGYTHDFDDPGAMSDPTAERFFGEPGMRTIYRRALLIAPWVNPYRVVESDGTVRDTFTLNGESVEFQARPGLVRVLGDNINHGDLQQALACLVAFQERYDLSVRLEWDPNLDPGDGRYVLVANTLADLTKRENRYEHHGFRPPESAGDPASRDFPYAALSMGSFYQGSNPAVRCQPDVESPNNPPQEPFPPTADDEGEALLGNVGTLEDVVVAYALDDPFPTQPGADRQRYKWRPFTWVNEQSGTLATARVVLNDNGEVVRIVHGLVPLSGERRGEDVMMSGVLAFDLRVYDPGAPLFRHLATDTILQPSDPGWRGLPTVPPTAGAYVHDDNMRLDGNGAIGSGATTFPYAGQGAYVDLGYGASVSWVDSTEGSVWQLQTPRYAQQFASSAPPWFFEPRGLNDVFGNPLAPGYSVYDTWSFHYENNGINEDADEVEVNAAGVPTWQLDDFDGVGVPSIDEGVNGVDDFGHYMQSGGVVSEKRLGVDDVGERETTPPYDRPLRGIQALVRTYETDSRAIRQVRVNQHFMAE